MKRPNAVSFAVAVVALLAATGCVGATSARGQGATTGTNAVTVSDTGTEGTPTEGTGTGTDKTVTPPSSTKGVIDIYKIVGATDIPVACVAIQDNGQQIWVLNNATPLPLTYPIGTSLKYVYVPVIAIDTSANGIVDDEELCVHAQTLTGGAPLNSRRQITMSSDESLGSCPPQ